MLIFSELIELFLNHYLYQQKERLLLIQPLYEKTFKIEFSELQYPFILFFKKNHIYIYNNWHDHLTCIIRIQLKDIFTWLLNPNPKQKNNIYFEIQGDLTAIQNLIIFIHEMSPNFLKTYFGNIKQYVFNQTQYNVQRLLKILTKEINIIKTCINLAITDEWKLVPHHLEVLWLIKKVLFLKKKEKYLLNRIQNLEKYYNDC